MTLAANAPVYIQLAAARLLESATITGPLAMTAAAFFYPRASNGQVFPQIVLERTKTTGQRIGNGSSYIMGEIAGILACDASAVDDATIEQYADQICHELCELIDDGLFIKSVTFGRPGSPTAGFWAASDAGQPDPQSKPIRTIAFSIEWGDG